MNFLPVVSDMQVLELAYSLHPGLSKQCLSFSDCTDISLGLVETNGFKALLSAQISFARLEDTVITLRSVKVSALDAGKVVVRLEPLQQINLRFELGKAIIDDMPIVLPEGTPCYSLAQHLVMGRLEHVLTEMDVFHLSINQRTVSRPFRNLLDLRGYRYTQEMYSKFLLMTGTANLLLIEGS